MLMRCLPLLLSIPLAAHAAPAERLSPEQAFDLFARALLESDANAADALRAARPADSILSEDGISTMASFVPSFVELIEQEATNRNIPASLAAELGELAAATYARSQCRATGRKAENDRAAAASDARVTITFSCQVPALGLDSGTFADPVVRQQMREDEAVAMRLLVEALRSAPARTITGVASIPGSAATGYFPDGLEVLRLTPVIHSILPMALLEELSE